MAVDLGVPGIGPGLRVGAGGFGTVFRAEQLGFGRQVAVKILNAVVEQDVELRRFERERQALGSVADHPNIVSVFGWGLTKDRRPYLIMEYLPAGTLATLVQQGPVPPDVAVSVTAKLARALAVAHERGVLHRDVKPENVLISAFGEPVLCDFGIARPASGGTTHTSSVATSVSHAAPEVLEGAPPSEAGDIWALVSTLHTLLAGRPPFTGTNATESMAAVITRVLTQPPPDLRTTGTPDDIADLVEDGLTKDPTSRIATATDLAQRLEAIQATHHWTPHPLPVTIPHQEPLPEPATDPVPVAAVVAAEPAPEPAAEPPPATTPDGTIHLKPTTTTPVGIEAALLAAGAAPPPEPPGPAKGRTGVLVAGGLVGLLTAALLLAAFALARPGPGDPTPSPTTLVTAGPSETSTTAPTTTLEPTTTTSPAPTTTAPRTTLAATPSPPPLPPPAPIVWTVVVRSVAYGASAGQTAQQEAARATRMGVPSRVVDARDHETLTTGYLAVVSGEFGSRAEADLHRDRIRGNGYPTAYRVCLGALSSCPSDHRCDPAGDPKFCIR